MYSCLFFFNSAFRPLENDLDSKPASLYRSKRVSLETFLKLGDLSRKKGISFHGSDPRLLLDFRAAVIAVKCQVFDMKNEFLFQISFSIFLFPSFSFPLLPLLLGRDLPNRRAAPSSSSDDDESWRPRETDSESRNKETYLTHDRSRDVERENSYYPIESEKVAYISVYIPNAGEKCDCYARIGFISFSRHLCV